jgi:hypothetical protein
MIKLYPVLVANSVSKNIIPGICKAIERFALIYKLDSLADQTRKDYRISLTKVGKNLVMKEETDEHLINFLSNEILFEDGTYDPSSRFGPGTKNTGSFSYVGSTNKPAGMSKKEWEEELQRERERSREKEFGKREALPADASISIGQMDMKSLSLEPTWMKIDMVSRGGARYTTVLGVKAVPAYVNSDAKLAQLLSFDKQVGRLMHLTLHWGRKVSGFLYRIYARSVQRVFDPDPRAISGNPYKDIVLKRTIIDKVNVDDVFLVLNQADLEEDFTVSAKGIRKLMRLGWQSFCIADDINRKLTFCMSQFQGMCQVVPYTMLYHTLDQARIFEDLEDVRRSTTSLFKSKIAVNKLFGESLASNRLTEYTVNLYPNDEAQQFINEMYLLDENIGAIAKRIVSAPKEMFLRLFKGTLDVPLINTDKMMKLGRKIDPQFIKAHALAKRVLLNSLSLKNIDEKYIDLAAIYITIKAKLSPGLNLLAKTKEVLLEVVPVFRKIIRKAKQSSLNIPEEHRIEAAIGISVLMGMSATIGASIWMMTKFFNAEIDLGHYLINFGTAVKLAIKKWFIEAGKVQVQEGEIDISFWKKLYLQLKPLFDKKIDEAKEYLEDSGANLKDSLHDKFGLTGEEASALLIMGVIIIFTIKFFLKRK